MMQTSASRISASSRDTDMRMRAYHINVPGENSEAYEVANGGCWPTCLAIYWGIRRRAAGIHKTRVIAIDEVHRAEGAGLVVLGLQSECHTRKLGGEAARVRSWKSTSRD